MAAQSARTDHSAVSADALPSERTRAKTPTQAGQTNTDMPTSDAITAAPALTIEANSLDHEEEIDDRRETEEESHPSSPPNPFDESDEEDSEGEKEEETETPAEFTTCGVLPPTSDSHIEEASRPVPAPRRVSEPKPLPRPAPRVRPPHTSNGLTVGKYQLQNIK